MLEGQQNPARHGGQHYFSGPVQEAITLCRKDQRFLLIFLKGDDRASTIADETIHSLLGRGNYHCVALRLNDELTSTDASAFKEAKSFREIFPDIPRLPFLMLLGPDGRPLASLAGEDVSRTAAPALQTAAAKFPGPEQERLGPRQSVDSARSSRDSSQHPRRAPSSQPPSPGGSLSGSIFRDPLPTVHSPTTSTSGSASREGLLVANAGAPANGGAFINPPSQIEDLSSALAEAAEQAAIFSAASTRQAAQNQQTQADVDSWRRNEPAAAILAPPTPSPSTSPTPTTTRSSFDSRAPDELAISGLAQDSGVPTMPEGAAEALKSVLAREMASMQGSNANTPTATLLSTQPGPSAIRQGASASTQGAGEGTRSSGSDALKSALANNVASVEFSDASIPAATQLGTLAGHFAGGQGISAPSVAAREGSEPLGLDHSPVGPSKDEGGASRQVSDSTLVLGEALQFRDGSSPSGQTGSTLTPAADAAAERAQSDAPAQLTAPTPAPATSTASATLPPPQSAINTPGSGSLLTASSLGGVLDPTLPAARGGERKGVEGRANPQSELETAGSFSFTPKVDEKAKAARAAAVARASAKARAAAAAAAERRRQEEASEIEEKPLKDIGKDQQASQAASVRSIGAAMTRGLLGAADGRPSAADRGTAAEGHHSHKQAEGLQNGASGADDAVGRGVESDVRASEVPAEITEDVKVQDGAVGGVSGAEDVLQNPELAQIAVRLTDGSFLRAEFLTEAPLSAVLKFVEKNRTDGWRPFSLRTPFPYRYLDAGHGDQTLQELDLCPRTLLVLHPKDSKAPIVLGQAGVMTAVRGVATSVATFTVTWLTALAAIIIGFFNGLFSSSGHPQRRGTTVQPVGASGGASSSDSAEHRRREALAPTAWGTASSSKGGAVSNVRPRRQPDEEGSEDARKSSAAD